MNKDDIDFSKVPDSSGVYLFYKGHVPLYIGKATNLRSRVKSYFDPLLPVKRSQKVAEAVANSTRIAFQTTDSVLEALLLEARLIKKWMPVGNTDAKDDKSYSYVIITKEKTPRILTVRGRSMAQDVPARLVKKRFGPFVHGLALRDAMKIIRSIFPFYDTPFPITDALSGAQRRKVSFNRSISVYPTDSVQYAKDVRHITLLFDGKKVQIVRELERDMKRAVAALRFEDASVIKKKLFALTHIRETALIGAEYREPDSAAFRIEAYDTSHLKGNSARAAMVVVEHAQPAKSEYRLFKIEDANGDDLKALTEVISRRFLHKEWPLPQLIVIDGGATHFAHAEKLIRKVAPRVSVVSVVKDERHKPKEILGRREIIEAHKMSILLANSEAHRFSLAKHRKAYRTAAIL